MMRVKRKAPGIGNITKSAIVDTKSQVYQKRLQEVMEIFQSETWSSPNGNDLPTTHFKSTASLEAYNTASLSKEMYESLTAEDVQLIWQLASLLYKYDQDASKQKKAVHQWLRDLVQPGLESQLSTITDSEDPFQRVFVYLSFGQRDLACEAAQSLNDYDLGMYIVHTETKNLRNIIKGHLTELQASEAWQTMSSYHKKCWYVIAGELGFQAKENFVVTDHVYWQCTLGMYIWYGDGQGNDQPCSLQNYNKALDRSGGDIHQLKTMKYTAKPDKSCLWYQLLQWWFGNRHIAVLDEWPHDLAWLLHVYTRQEEETYLIRWIDELEKQDLADWAIYVCLFLKSPKSKLDYLLRQCEWSEEKKLINEYHIPSMHVQIAKALNAHDSWDYETEYTVLINGNLFQQAKLALFHFLLPKIFQNEASALETSIGFIHQYPIDQQDKEIKLLAAVYSYLTSNEPSDEQLSQSLVDQLVLLQARYQTRSTHRFLKDLTDAIKLKV